uniref:BET1-like protein n=1 Tax=Sphaerodactylus townsendi TaxID=933632 RepID=A0ACB8G3Y3_9SAUR
MSGRHAVAGPKSGNPHPTPSRPRLLLGNPASFSSERRSVTEGSAWLLQPGIPLQDAPPLGGRDGPRRQEADMADWGRGQNPSAVDEMIDMENKRMAENLSTKVTRLKSLALDIDKDAEDQNHYVDGMDTDFMSVTGLLTGSVKRFSTMTRSGRDNRKLLCYVSVGLVVVFFILYYLVTRART